jgi:hypothetical protein
VTALFGEAFELVLDKRGIRSIENDGHGGYLIVAGAIDKESASSLYRWSGKKSDQPMLLTKVDFTGLNPEAMHLIPGTGEVEILSDDGNDACDSENDLSKKSFRGIVVKPAELTP